MYVERSRITLLVGGAAFTLGMAVGLPTPVGATGLPEVMVYRSPT